MGCENPFHDDQVPHHSEESIRNSLSNRGNGRYGSVKEGCTFCIPDHDTVFLQRVISVKTAHIFILDHKGNPFGTFFISLMILHE